jgi:hypothetical protein
MNKRKNRNARIRLKGDYYVIEKLEGNKVIKSLTLNPQKTWDLLMCQTQNNPNVSEKEGKNGEKQDQTFAQPKLAVVLETDKSLTQMGKSLMNGAVNRSKYLGINNHFAYDYMRPTILKLRNNICDSCGLQKKDGELDVHHEDYINQNIDTLRLLCKSCHKNLHNKKDTVKKLTHFTTSQIKKMQKVNIGIVIKEDNEDGND